MKTIMELEESLESCVNTGTFSRYTTSKFEALNFSYYLSRSIGVGGGPVELCMHMHVYVEDFTRANWKSL